MGDGRVLQLLGPSSGGIRRVVASLTESLEAHGWPVSTAGPVGSLDRIDHVVPVPSGVSLAGALAARRALAPLAASAEIVHAHGLKAGWVAASLRPRPPLVVSVHNLVLDQSAGLAAPLLRILEGRLPSACDRVIALSPEVARRFGSADNLVTIAPAATVPRPERTAGEVRTAYGVAAGEHLLVSVSRLHPQKDLPMLIDAVDRVRRRIEGVRLLIVGGGPEEAALRSKVDDLDLGTVVIFAGARTSAADELAAADVVTVSSSWESGPLVLFEALQLGRPVVTTDVGAAAEVVVDGRTGRLVPVGDPATFAEAVVDLLSDPDRAAVMGLAGQRAVAERHGPEAMALATEAVYREVLA